MEALPGAIASAIGMVVTAVAGYLTARASAAGQAEATRVTTLTDLERDAATRMAGIYTTALSQLQAELAEERAEVSALDDTVADLRTQLSRCTCRPPA